MRQKYRCDGGQYLTLPTIKEWFFYLYINLLKLCNLSLFTVLHCEFQECHALSRKALITGGAGFIGSNLADELLNQGYKVRILDNLAIQVHGEEQNRPAYLSDEVELVIGDIRNPDVVYRALRGVDVVCHLAAVVGVGQSMYELCHYTSINNLGTAVLLEALIKNPIEALVVASSMSIYGEGLYSDSAGAIYTAARRTKQQLQENRWEVYNDDEEILQPIPTPENKPPDLSSVYALSKYDQEKLCLLTGQAYDIPTVALRFFNTYGPYQALSNPYTGVLAIFASRLLNNNSPIIFEDGCQMRDFIHVRDIAQACRLALEVPEAAYQSFNIGSGNKYTIRYLAEYMANVLGKTELCPEIMGKYRVGDIRHCFADISQARTVLGYEPRISLEEGMVELAQWLEGQIAHDHSAEATNELIKRGLAVG